MDSVPPTRGQSSHKLVIATSKYACVSAGIFKGHEALQIRDRLLTFELGFILQIIKVCLCCHEPKIN